MKHSAFTMIELIFVIIVLGILTAMALPKISGIQDDALITSEKAGIGAMRMAIASIHGKALMRGSNDFKIYITNHNGINNYISINNDGGQPEAGQCDLSPQKYPLFLSISTITSTANGKAHSVQTSTSDDPTQTEAGRNGAVALLLQQGNLDQYKTTKVDNNTKITGPATNVISKDSDSELTIEKYWIYNSETGAIVLH